MAPLGVSARPDGEWQLIHRCLGCGELSANRIAGDDNALVLVRLAMRPLSGLDAAGTTNTAGTTATADSANSANGVV